MHATALRGDPNGRRIGRVSRRVREEVVEDLDDAPGVGHHPRQIFRQVDAQGVRAAAAQESPPGLLHEPGHLRRLDGDRQGARLDAPLVQQVGDQAAHLIGLLVDDPEELVHFGGVELRGRSEQGGGRADDGHQRRPQLMAHHGQELGPQPLQLLQRREVLQGHHHRLDRAFLGPDRCRVDQHRDAPAVRDRERDLLGAHPLGAAQLFCHRELRQGDHPPVPAAAGDHVQQLLDRTPRHAQRVDDPPRLPVERHELAAAAVEDDDAYRRGLDQGLQVGPRPLAPPGACGRWRSPSPPATRTGPGPPRRRS